MRYRALVLLLILMPLVGTIANAAPPKWLSGVTGLKVMVDRIPEALRTVGLTEDHIRTDVELRLRRAGIPLREDAPASLYVSLNAVGGRDGNPIAVSMDVAFREPVLLERDPGIVTQGITWTNGVIGSYGEKVAKRSVRDAVSDLADSFANDFLAANAK